MQRELAGRLTLTQRFDWHRLRALALARWQVEASGLCLAVALAIYMTSPLLYSKPLAIAWALGALGIAFADTRRPPLRVLIGGGIIVGSAFVAVPIAWFLNPSYFIHTCWLAMLTLILAPLAWVRDVQPIIRWLTPLWLIHSLWVLYQWAIHDSVRAIGTTGNANVGAAFLLLGLLVLLNGNRLARWAALVLIVAFPFAGSRWATLVAAPIVSGLFLTRNVPVRWVLPGMVAAVALVTLVGWDSIQAGFHRPSTLDIHVKGYQSREVATGEASDWRQWIIPSGFYDSGIETVPLRMAKETGVLSALAWLGLCGWGLSRKPWFDQSWWLLCAVVLLSGMYYCMWAGELGAWWWLLVGRGTRTRETIEND